eukprot:304484-Rhodomonas_salina.1
MVVVCPILLRNVTAAQVVRIDLPTILLVLSVVKNIGDPNASVKRFRSCCIDPFMSRQRARMAVNWSIVMKLYLTAFQRMSIRHECWKEVVQRNEHLCWDQACTAEALQAVDSFVEREPFDTAYALRTVEQSVRSVECTR